MDQVAVDGEEGQEVARMEVGDLKLLVRAIRPEDAVHLVDLFEHMGPESRFLRFNLSLVDPDPSLVWREARRLARIDPERDGAWLAFADLPDQTGAPVAGARFIRQDDSSAEAAVAVRDDLQRQGIGTALLRHLVTQAQKAGVHRLTATIQRINRPIWILLKRSNLTYSIDYEGAYATITAELGAE